MEYNELKLLILRIVSTNGSIDAASLVTKLESDQKRMEAHAVRMAVMRYYKLGLLKRARTGGVFTYSLSERGIARLTWLEQQTVKKQ